MSLAGTFNDQSNGRIERWDKFNARRNQELHITWMSLNDASLKP